MLQGICSSPLNRETELVSHLGKDSNYVTTYDSSLLRPILRSKQRTLIGASESIPFLGLDRWRCYELTWLDSKGKPDIAVLSIRVPCMSVSIVESKSLKLYLNSFAQTQFRSRQEVLETIAADLKQLLQADIIVEFEDLSTLNSNSVWLNGNLLEKEAEAAADKYPDPAILVLDGQEMTREEIVFTHLFRSVCPETAQPDLASIFIRYRGQAISPDSLLSYLLSFRNHAAFHETVIEQIFIEIKERCSMDELSVYGCFLRRGGIDINPFRSTHEHQAPLFRVPRQ